MDSTKKLLGNEVSFLVERMDKSPSFYSVANISTVLVTTGVVVGLLLAPTICKVVGIALILLGINSIAILLCINNRNKRKIQNIPQNTLTKNIQPKKTLKKEILQYLLMVNFFFLACITDAIMLAVAAVLIALCT